MSATRCRVDCLVPLDSEDREARVACHVAHNCRQAVFGLLSPLGVTGALPEENAGRKIGGLAKGCARTRSMDDDDCKILFREGTAKHGEDADLAAVRLWQTPLHHVAVTAFR
ncbi:hypothetical protein F442_03705 [Phytophthora nicotianae P10297]|uniref:Uncharacterized protein n=2 Tax=Phytophthora nicotianae TaxID=4792 RepID=W2QLU7_PHYN3|nr:hypothetical protein PPTG_22264 [Phytophthora nicotianae INRA-310]ETN13881.1 hypothetical protein PPTG_22264 [Phytophthora nicotianae INRA-310]ETP51091.1 hypothetical protein F442_03705 [Phytophthora nicotianae P10297]